MVFLSSRAPNTNSNIYVFNFIQSTTIFDWRVLLRSFSWQLRLCSCIIDVEIVLGVHEKRLKKRLRAKTTRIETAVLVVIFGMLLPIVSPHLIPHISAES